MSVGRTVWPNAGHALPQAFAQLHRLGIFGKLQLGGTWQQDRIMYPHGIQVFRDETLRGHPRLQFVSAARAVPSAAVNVPKKSSVISQSLAIPKRMGILIQSAFALAPGTVRRTGPALPASARLSRQRSRPSSLSPKANPADLSGNSLHDHAFSAAAFSPAMRPKAMASGILLPPG